MYTKMWRNSVIDCDNAVQQRTLNTWNLDLNHAIRAPRRIEIRKQKGLAAAAEEVREGSAKLHMDEIRGLIGEMRLEENRLLKLRTEEADASSRTARIVIVTGEALAVAFLCLAELSSGKKWSSATALRKKFASSIQVWSGA